MFRIEIRFRTKILTELYHDKSFLGVLPLGKLPFELNKSLLEPSQEVFLKKSQYHDFEEDTIVIIKREIYKYSWTKVCNYLARRERCSFEVSQYLEGLIAEDIIPLILENLKKIKYLDDIRFTEFFIRDAQRKKKARYETADKLKHLYRIEESTINRQIATYYTDENSIIDKLIDKYLTKSSVLNLSFRETFDKTAAYLMRKGFRFSDFSDTLKVKIKKEKHNFS